MYNRLGYEVYKGIHLTLTQESTEISRGATLQKTSSYGPGFLFYPRPHLEFSGVWQFVRTPSLYNETYSVASLVGHLYF